MDSIKKVINQVLDRWSSGQETLETRIQQLWNLAIDKKTQKHTRIVSFQDHTLWVSVDSPAWLFQLTLQKKRILGKIKQEIPDLTTIVFKIGKVI